jgi:hypothetical protein
VRLTPKSVEIREFAQRVERLCDFLLAQVDTEQSGSQDVLPIKDLKEDAADIQFNRADITNFDGLDAYMKGLDKEST